MKYFRLFSPLIATPKRTLINIILCCLLMTNKGLCEPVRLLEVFGQGASSVVKNELMARLTISEQGDFPTKLNVLIDKKTQYIKSIATSNDIDNSKISFNKTQQALFHRSFHNPVHVIALNKDNGNKVYIDNSVLSQQQTDTINYLPEYNLSRLITVNFETLKQKQLFLGQVSHIAKQDFTQLLSLEEHQSYYQKALLMAIDSALIKAKLITQKTGMKLGHIVLLQELNTDFSQIKNNNANLAASVVLNNYSEAKKTRVLANVLIKFKLID